MASRISRANFSLVGGPKNLSRRPMGFPLPLPGPTRAAQLRGCHSKNSHIRSLADTFLVDLPSSVRRGVPRQRAASAPSESQVFPLMDGQPDLLRAAPPPVVPQQPTLAVENRVRLVHGV